MNPLLPREGPGPISFPGSGLSQPPLGPRSAPTLGGNDAPTSLHTSGPLVPCVPGSTRKFGETSFPFLSGTPVYPLSLWSLTKDVPGPVSTVVDPHLRLYRLSRVLFPGETKVLSLSRGNTPNVPLRSEPPVPPLPWGPSSPPDSWSPTPHESPSTYVRTYTPLYALTRVGYPTRSPPFGLVRHGSPQSYSTGPPEKPLGFSTLGDLRGRQTQLPYAPPLPSERAATSRDPRRGSKNETHPLSSFLVKSSGRHLSYDIRVRLRTNRRLPGTRTGSRRPSPVRPGAFGSYL